MPHSAEVAFNWRSIVSAVVQPKILNTTRRRGFLLGYRIGDGAMGMPSATCLPSLRHSDRTHEDARTCEILTFAQDRICEPYISQMKINTSRRFRLL